MNPARLISIAIPALMLASPGLAHAAGLSADTACASSSGGVLQQTLTLPCESDWWRQMLQLVFPNTGPLTGADTAASSGLKSATSAFLAVLMALATGALAWHVVSGAVATAHEGQMLGSKWHQTWAPIRVVLGWGMLAPVASGLCFAQVLVLYVALWSGSLGNVIWSSYISGMTSPTLAAPAVAGTGELVHEFTELELCRAAYMPGAGYLEQLPQSPPSETDGGDTGENVSVSLGNLYNRVSSAFGGGSVTSQAQTNRHVVAWNYGLCGTISGPFSGGTESENLASVGSDPSLAYDHARLVAIEAARTQIDSGVATYIKFATNQNPAPTSGTDAKQQLATAKADLAAAMTAAKSTLDTGFTNAAQTMVNASGSSSGDSHVSALQTDAGQYGWLTAGMYYVTISRLQSAAMTLAADLPEMSVPPSGNKGLDGYIDKETLETTGNVLSAAQDTVASTVEGWNTSPDTSSLTNAASAGSLAGNGASVHSAMSWIFRKVYALGDKYLVGIDASGAHGSVIQQLSAFGNETLNLVGGVVFGGGAAAAIFGGPGAVVGLASMVATGPLSWVGIILMLLIFVGVEHAYLVPMLPFIEFVFVAFQVLTDVLVAFVVIPIWSFQHIRLDGAELVNEQQRSGYLLLLSLFFRIPILMLCYLLSLSALQAGAWLVSRSFSVAMMSATADSGAGLIGAVVMLVIQGWLIWRLATLSLRLMTAGPDLAARLLGWTIGQAQSENPSHFVGGLVGRVGAAGHGIGRGKSGKPETGPGETTSGGATAGKSGGAVEKMG